MSDMTGHNNPPSAVDEFSAMIEDHAVEVENWLDGTPVETDGQMATVELLIARTKSFEGEAKTRKDIEYRPHKNMCDKVVADWKPQLDDIAKMKTGLLAIITPYKQEKARIADEERREKKRIADEKRREAEALMHAANAADIESVRDAERALAESADAAKEASSAQKIKGMRTYKTPVIEDEKAFVSWLLSNRIDELKIALEAIASKEFRAGNYSMDGVAAHIEKRAF